MNTVRIAGRATTIDITLADGIGTPISPIDGTISWSMTDSAGDVVATGAAPVAASDGQVAIELSAEDMTTTASATGLEITLLIPTDGGTVSIIHDILIMAEIQLVTMENSFATYAEMRAVRTGFGPTLDGWDAADRTNRAAASQQAFERLLRLSYRIPFPAGRQASDYAGYGIGSDVSDLSRPARLDRITATEFATLPPRFQKAVKRAQLVEADAMLGGDPVGRKRELGITSERTGESETSFQSKPYLNLPISRRAYEELRRYIIFTVGIVRG